MLYTSSADRGLLWFKERLRALPEEVTLDLGLGSQGGFEHTEVEGRNISETMSKAWEN